MTNLENIILYHVHKYPLMQIRDIFKLLYQNEFGGEHLVKDKDSVIEYLDYELDTLPTEFDDEFIDIGNDIVRVDLHYIKNHKDEFINAFLLSCEEVKGSIASYKNKIQLVRNMIIEKKIDFSLDEFDAFYDLMESNSFPSLSHSQVFRENYYPHYRIVRKKFISWVDIC